MCRGRWSYINPAVRVQRRMKRRRVAPPPHSCLTKKGNKIKKKRETGVWIKVSHPALSTHTRSITAVIPGGLERVQTWIVILFLFCTDDEKRSPASDAALHSELPVVVLKNLGAPFCVRGSGSSGSSWFLEFPVCRNPTQQLEFSSFFFLCVKKTCPQGLRGVIWI